MNIEKWSCTPSHWGSAGYMEGRVSDEKQRSNVSNNISELSNTDESDRDYLTAKVLDQGNKLEIAPAFISKLQLVFAKLPLNVLKALSDLEPVFLAPGQELGRVFGSHPTIHEEMPIVYLSPELLNLPEEHAQGVIAHELAHLYLRHSEEFSKDPLGDAYRGELEADLLAESWGFTLPAERKVQLMKDGSKLTGLADKSSEPE